MIITRKKWHMETTIDITSFPLITTHNGSLIEISPYFAALYCVKGSPIFLTYFMPYVYHFLY